MALFALNYLSHLLISAIEAVIEQVFRVFMISSLIGSYVVFYVNTIVRLFLIGIDSLLTLTKIVFEDFMIFLFDVGTILALICELLLVLLTCAIEKSIAVFVTLKDAVLYVFKLPIIIYLSFLSTVESFLQFIVNTAFLIKRAITLIGTSIWMALTFVPSILLYLLHAISLSCVELVVSIYEYVFGMVTGILSGFCEMCVKVLYFFVDIPCEACGGLALGMVLAWLIYKQQHLFETFFGNVYRLHLKAVTAFIHVVRQSCQFLIRQVKLYCRHVYRRRGHASDRVSVDEMFFTHRNNPAASSSNQSVSSNYMLKLKKKLEAELEEKLCSVCQERRKTVIVLPCRHLCLCVECVMPVERMSKKCPLCRRHITKTMGVYL